LRADFDAWCAAQGLTAGWSPQRFHAELVKRGVQIDRGRVPGGTGTTKVVYGLRLTDESAADESVSTTH
jgi:hypothetical protein